MALLVSRTRIHIHLTTAEHVILQVLLHTKRQPLIVVSLLRVGAVLTLLLLLLLLSACMRLLGVVRLRWLLLLLLLV